jgi:transcriptional regulator with XRE-family HTH domain
MTDQAKTSENPRDIGEVFGEVVQVLRRERGLSQEELAFESDLHRTYISLLERGKRIPGLKTIFQLAMALKIPPSEIVRRVESTMGWSLEETHSKE